MSASTALSSPTSSNGAGRSKHGEFYPDFFLLLADTDEVIVVETKSDPDDSPKNAGKVAHALMHFKAVNELLEGAGATRRYSFHLVSPQDYDLFFERLRNGELDLFVSSLQAALSA